MVLLGRFYSEYSADGPGLYQGVMYHDDWCPGLVNESYSDCECKPEIKIAKWEGY